MERLLLVFCKPSTVAVVGFPPVNSPTHQLVVAQQKQKKWYPRFHFSYHDEAILYLFHPFGCLGRSGQWFRTYANSRSSYVNARRFSGRVVLFGVSHVFRCFFNAFQRVSPL